MRVMKMPKNRQGKLPFIAVLLTFFTGCVSVSINSTKAPHSITIRRLLVVVDNGKNLHAGGMLRDALEQELNERNVSNESVLVERFTGPKSIKDEIGSFGPNAILVVQLVGTIKTIYKRRARESYDAYMIEPRDPDVRIWRARAVLNVVDEADPEVGWDRLASRIVGQLGKDGLLKSSR